MATPFSYPRVLLYCVPIPRAQLNSDELFTAANWVALGIGYNTGQDCTAGSRLYVQDTIYDKFVTLLVGKMKELVVGNGFDDASGAGPVVCPFCSTMLRG